MRAKSCTARGRIYGPALAKTQAHPGITIGAAVALLVVAILVGSNLGTEFLPRLDEGALTVTTTKLPGISLASALQTQEMVERTLMRFPEVQTTVTLGGSSEIPTDPMGVEQSDTFIILKPQFAMEDGADPSRPGRRLFQGAERGRARHHAGLGAADRDAHGRHAAGRAGRCRRS